MLPPICAGSINNTNNNNNRVHLFRCRATRKLLCYQFSCTRHLISHTISYLRIVVTSVGGCGTICMLTLIMIKWRVWSVIFLHIYLYLCSLICYINRQNEMIPLFWGIILYSVFENQITHSALNSCQRNNVHGRCLSHHPSSPHHFLNAHIPTINPNNRPKTQRGGTIAARKDGTRR